MGHLAEFILENSHRKLGGTNVIKKILLAIAAMAMSFATVAVAGAVGSGVAGAATPPPTTITCTSAGTFSFAAPGSSAGGALTAGTTVKSSVTTTPTGTGCSGLPITLDVVSPTTPCAQTGGVPNAGDPAACLASKTSHGVTTYAIASKPNVYDDANDYASSGLTNLENSWQAKAPKTTVDNIAVTLTYGSATDVEGGACGSYVGFDITGNAEVKGLTVGTFDDLVCLTDDAGTGTTHNFLADLFSPTAVITSGIVGGNSSLTVVFPSESCPVTGSVTFAAPGLSAGGALTSAATATTKSSTTATGTGCSGVASSLNIASATTPCPQTSGVPNAGDPAACLASKTSHGVTTYAIGSKPNYYDTDGSYATSGLTNLEAALQAKPPKTTVDNVAVTLAYGSASEVIPGGACGASDVGFDVSGNAQVKGLTVGTYTDIVCLSGDAGTGTSGDFLTDLGSSTAVISSATIGGDSSLTVSF